MASNVSTRNSQLIKNSNDDLQSVFQANKAFSPSNQTQSRNFNSGAACTPLGVNSQRFARQNMPSAQNEAKANSMGPYQQQTM